VGRSLAGLRVAILVHLRLPRHLGQRSAARCFVLSMGEYDETHNYKNGAWIVSSYFDLVYYLVFAASSRPFKRILRVSYGEHPMGLLMLQMFVVKVGRNGN
jgi:hypothetical protein